MGKTMLLIVATLASQVMGHYQDAFEQFKTQHQRNYANAEEHNLRRIIFEKNLEMIEKHNAEEKLGLHSFRLGLNQFADLSEEEFKQRYLGGPPKQPFEAPENGKKFTRRPLSKGKRQVKAPESVNWVEKGFVSPVRNQMCGDCWAFASAANIESNWAIKTQTKINDTKYWVSVQQLADCTYNQPTCGGGSQNDAFRGVKKAGGIMWEKDYPYHGVQASESCTVDVTKAQIGVSGLTDYPKGSEVAMFEDVISSPVTFGVCLPLNPIQKSQFYKDGILTCTEPCSGHHLPNHAGLAVGYGQENGIDYWLVKNSWGVGWGEQGYYRLTRNMTGKQGCVAPQGFPHIFVKH